MDILKYDEVYIYDIFINQVQEHVLFIYRLWIF